MVILLLIRLVRETCVKCFLNAEKTSGFFALFLFSLVSFFVNHLSNLQKEVNLFLSIKNHNARPL